MVKLRYKIQRVIWYLSSFVISGMRQRLVRVTATSYGSTNHYYQPTIYVKSWRIHCRYPYPDFWYPLSHTESRSARVQGVYWRVTGKPRCLYPRSKHQVGWRRVENYVKYHCPCCIKTKSSHTRSPINFTLRPIKSPKLPGNLQRHSQMVLNHDRWVRNIICEAVCKRVTGRGVPDSIVRSALIPRQVYHSSSIMYTPKPPMCMR